MTKNFTLMVLFLLLIGTASFSQTATLATVSASPGQNVPVALNVTGFTGIGSITFHLQFDPAVMTLSGITLPPNSPWQSQGQFWGVSGNTINIVGVWVSNANFTPGKMFDLNFTYNGMTTGALTFLGSCEVTQGLTQIFPAYTNGAVSMATVPQTATLLPASAGTGGNVSVPIDYENFTGSFSSIGSITQKIHYDPTKLNFVSVTGVGSLAAGTVYSADIANGLISITWTNAVGANINWSNQFLLNFVFIGNSSTNIDFVAGCLISTTTPVTNVPVSYTGSTITYSAVPTATAVLGSVTGALQGQDYEVPLTLSGFPTSGITGPTEAFTLTIPYNYPRLSFLGIKSPVPAGVTLSQASGTLTLTWYDPSGLTNINGTFLTLKFRYDGIGVANVGFGNGCVFNTYNGTVGTVQVAYTNATITPAVASANATIGFVQATAGTNVNVPVTFAGLPASNMGAVTLYFTYDYNKLTYIDLQNNIFGANAQLNPTTHIISVTWSSGSGTALNGKFVDLRFAYNGGGADCGAAVNFADGCELAELGIPPPIVQVNWNNGGVNLMFKVSGYLTYASGANTPLNNSTVNLKSGANVVGTATTDATGYFEIYALNGSYTIQAVCPKAWGGVSAIDVARMRQHVLGILPLTGLPLKAGDVNGAGGVTTIDIALVQQRILGQSSSFPVGNWAFEVPTVVLNCADQTVNFHGLAYGDVNASYTPPVAP